MPPTKPCGQPLPDGRDCERPRKRTKTKCEYHYLLAQPIEVQVRAAQQRRADPHFIQVRKTVPQSEWPAGDRFCSGCQHFVPLWYTSGSQCKACASRAAHGSHVRRTYGLAPDEYQALLEWQGGRCFVCGQVPRTRRLAVDHDHRTGEVRGLLCSNDEWGCNVTLARVLNDPRAAERLVEYVQRHPLQRMRDGEPARTPPRRPNTLDLIRAAPRPQELPEWRPFG